MKILLINDNPVVSRLLAMCTRRDGVVLEEVIDVHSIQDDVYDIVFVDDGLDKEEVLNVLNMISIGKKVLFSTSDTSINDFDIIMQKPFLPSQIIELLEENEQDVEEIKPQVLNHAEVEKIKLLLEMDDEIDIKDEVLSEEEIEQRKVKIIKEQLIAEGLEIVDEEEMVEGLSVDNSVIFTKEMYSKKKSKKKKISKNKEKKSKKKKTKSIAFTEEELEDIEDAVQVAIATLKRKQMKKLLKGKKIELTIQLKDDE